MFALLLGIALLGLFALRVHREPRRFGNGILLLIALAFTVIGLLDTDGSSALSFMVFVVIVLSPLLVLVLAGLLIANGVQMVRREGRRVANLLSFGLGVALVAPYVLLVVTLLIGRTWFVAAMASITLMVSYIGFLLLAFLLYSTVYLRLPYRRGMGAIVVHGSGLIGARVPPLLASRLDRALDVYSAEVASGNRPLLVTSGGKGSDEALAEADAMAGYLIDKGLPGDAILREDRSTTTRENLLYTRQLLAERGIDARMVLVTSNFHALRTAILARQLGLDADVAGAPTALYYLPSAILREFAGILVEHKWVNAFVCLLLGSLPWLALAAVPADPVWH
ncbi:YdcF family protein [Nocardia huaxiensis]|uniref:YdcF family protein n=1 Tax=Nocardia huaxiensis TaxID=2755382 RepID=A0A7D6VBL5_9NOCA|nr:YdcF family protein [Nocardia huaxiensis]QLY28355.1 YdcF family protein [Nocardia huaxiensis]UFS98199.1 YdcF family protein [Nocardia huaxiensis]